MLIWFAFIGFILLLLALDLGVFHRKAHAISVKEALGWSAFWIALGLSFSVFVYFAYEHHWQNLGSRVDIVDGAINDGRAAVVKYLTGYIVEKSLSVDNIFVIALLFSFFAVPDRYQHRVLFWGIIGALAMRGFMIGVGAALIREFHWILYVFGGFLIFTAFKMLFLKTGETDPNNNIVVKLTRRFFPVTSKFHGEHFFVRAGSTQSHEPQEPGMAEERDEAVEQAKPGTWMLTPLALVLIMVEFTDLIFAVDSIPAIFAITADPFLVFSSNTFAILGLRSLYFALAGMMHKFVYLKASLAIVLLIVGGKMLAANQLKALLGPDYTFHILALILLTLAAGVVASLYKARRDSNAAA